MTTMNQFIPPQRKLDRSVPEVEDPAKMDGHFKQTSRPISVIGLSIFVDFQLASESG